MCGIAGFSGNFSEQLLSSMGAAIAHRGPNGQGAMVLPQPESSVGLAHRRLSIIDLSPAGHQPMTVSCSKCSKSSSNPSDARRLWLTYNGEVYNYRELHHELRAKGHTFKSKTDSEVLLHLYAEEGTGMLSRLNGMFAFAIYDGRIHGQRDGVHPGDLFLARDGLGIKPLYYTQTKSGFLFASEIKALLQCPETSRTLDPVALHYYLAYLWAPSPWTMLKGVNKLSPGQALLVRSGHIVNQWTFYDLPYGRPWLDRSEDDIAAELRDRVETAVSRQLVSDVPVGAFLSGGLDSSAIVAMMRRINPKGTLTCYSIGFANDTDLEGSPSDLPYARAVSKHLGIHLNEIEVKPDIIQHLQRMLYYLDEPQGDPAPINALLIAEQARRDGIPVLLSGAGGDDIFSGYRRHWALKMERLWGWLPQRIRLGIARWSTKSGNGINSITPSGFYRRITKVFAHAHLSPEDRMIAYFYWSGEEIRRSLYSRELADELDEVDTAEPLRRSLHRIRGECDSLNRMLYLDAKHFLADHNLNYTDKMGMAAGVEIRVPLLDLELVDFATRIPSAMKQKGRIGKAIFKKAMESDLPNNVIYRPKSGFGVPLRRWLKRELRDVVDDTLSAHSLKQRGLFDPRSVQCLVDLDREGRVDGSYTVFSMICIELWCRAFLDDRVPTPA
jgi:asparagine synthase (glutamine-hydrolysing)